MNTRKRLLKSILVYKGRLALAVFSSWLVSLAMAASGGLLKWFTDAADGKTSDIFILPYIKQYHLFTGSDKWIMMKVVVIGALVTAIPKAIFMYLSMYPLASLTNRLGADIRSQMYTHIQSLPLKFFHRSRIGDLMSRMSNDVTVIQQSSQVLVQAINGPTTFLVSLCVMLFISWKMTLLAVVCVPPMGFAVDKISRKIKKLTTVTQESLSDINSKVEETVRGVRIIKIFGMEQAEVDRFNVVNSSSLNAAQKSARRSSLVLPSAELMGGVAVAFLILVGGYMISSNLLSLSGLIYFAYMAVQVADAGKQFGRISVVYQQVLAAAERVYEIIDTKSDLLESDNAVAIDKPLGKVECRNVYFAYNQDEPVLNGISFRIEPGEIVAIVGSSGAGKSTIADLIPRFYDVIDGQILIDDIDVRDLKIKCLRDMIAMVPQETILFSGTIAQNIAYGRPGASEDEIIAAAKSANAHEFIIAQSDGYQTMLGESGVGLSGGQRQRIAIARALLKNPGILILDEATSSLDAASESAVQDALDKLMKGRSTLVIAHRLSTVRNADKIIVMDKGRIVESGSFDQLVGQGGTFSELYRTQYRSEEAVNAD